MARKYRTVFAIWQWLLVISQARLDVGVDSLQYSDAEILAFISVESSGSPRADNGSFFGLLQMGGPAFSDVVDVPFPKGASKKTKRKLRKAAAKEALIGEPLLGVTNFLLYMEKYYQRHDGISARKAVLWKGGPGTASVVERRLNRGDTLREACLYAEAYTIDDDPEIEIPNLEVYVLDEYCRALKVWEGWVDKQNDRYSLSSAEVFEAEKLISEYKESKPDA